MYLHYYEEDDLIQWYLQSSLKTPWISFSTSLTWTFQNVSRELKITYIKGLTNFCCNMHFSSVCCDGHVMLRNKDEQLDAHAPVCVKNIVTDLWIDRRLQWGKLLTQFSGCAEKFKLCRTNWWFSLIFFLLWVRNVKCLEIRFVVISHAHFKHSLPNFMHCQKHDSRTEFVMPPSGRICQDCAAKLRPSIQTCAPSLVTVT